MRKVIDGITYDTCKATVLARDEGFSQHPNSSYPGDTKPFECGVYRHANGTLFAASEGHHGSLSRVGAVQWRAYKTFEVFETPAEAARWAYLHGLDLDESDD